MPKLHVLLTGGAGYLGSIITEHFLAAGHRVTVLDNLLYGQTPLLQHAANPEFDFIKGDARDEQLVKSALKQADIIIPLAAIVGASACDRDPVAARTLNTDAVRMLCERRSPHQLLIFPVTNSGYGTKSGDSFCTEDTPLDPISLYGVTKVEAEQIVLDSPNSVSFRLATVFGIAPRMRLDLLVNHFTYAAYFDRYLVIFEKHFKRNYVHIRDVADCFLFATANSKKLVGRCYNLGLDDANLSKEELALKIKEYVPDFFIHFAEIGQDPDKRNYIVSNQRLREAGFAAKRSLDEGIRELLKGYRMLPRMPMRNA